MGGLSTFHQGTVTTTSISILLIFFLRSLSSRELVAPVSVFVVMGGLNHLYRGIGVIYNLCGWA